MAPSNFKVTQHTSSTFIESAGVVLIDPKTKRVCLLHHKARDEWSLPKGRRNVGESRAAAASREAREETGVECRLLPVHLRTRQTLETDAADVADGVRVVEGVVEPFMFTMRELKQGRVKLIWWFVAVPEEGARLEGDGGEGQFEVGWFGFEEAIEVATFASDREVLREGSEVFDETVSD